jgi:hypothetical protein
MTLILTNEEIESFFTLGVPSTSTGELLAIFPDALRQASRVGVTNALSAKYMVRSNSSVLAVDGSGWQARPAVLAMCKVVRGSSRCYRKVKPKFFRPAWCLGNVACRRSRHGHVVPPVYAAHRVADCNHRLVPLPV